MFLAPSLFERDKILTILRYILHGPLFRLLDLATVYFELYVLRKIVLNHSVGQSAICSIQCEEVVDNLIAFRIRWVISSFM